MENATVQPTAPVATAPVENAPTMPTESEINSFDSAQLKVFAEKQGVRVGTKKTGIIPPEKEMPREVPKIDDTTPNGEVRETPTEAKPVEAVKETPKTEFNIEEMKAQLKEQILNEINTKKVEVAPPEPVVVLKPEELEKMYNENPQSYVEYQFKQIKNGLMDEMRKEMGKIVKEKIEPNISHVDGERLRSQVTQAEGKYPELKDVAFKQKLAPLMKKYEGFIEAKEKMGENPFEVAMSIYRAENLPEILKQAKEQGIQEGEKKSVANKQAFVEGAGKTQVEQKLDFEKMTAEEMKKYLPKKVY